MSTTYLAPMPIGEFVAKAKALGWRDGKTATHGGYALISPNGHYCHDIEQNVGGTTFVRGGGNTDVDDLAEALRAVSEDDLGYVGLWKLAAKS